MGFRVWGLGFQVFPRFELITDSCFGTLSMVQGLGFGARLALVRGHSREWYLARLAFQRILSPIPDANAKFTELKRTCWVRVPARQV